jgi:hypothetical protein
MTSRSSASGQASIVLAKREFLDFISMKEWAKEFNSIYLKHSNESIILY